MELENDPTDHACRTCKYYHARRGLCVLNAPVAMSPDAWGCCKHSYSFGVVFELWDRLARLKKRMNKAKRTIRQLKTKIKKYELAEAKDGKTNKGE